MKILLRAIVALSVIYNFHSLYAQVPFQPVDSNYQGTKLIIPSGTNYTILFEEGDIVRNNKGIKALAKGEHDFTTFLPDSNHADRGRLLVSHESNDTSTILGDGGGATIFPIRKMDNRWVVDGPYEGIDFTEVGGTYQNCSGVLTKSGTILSAEEFPPSSNKELYKRGKGFRDTSDFQGLQRWQNMGWMVEIDPVTKKAVRKLFGMGRFSHEMAYIMEDNQTVFLTDDFLPAVFFKFIAHTPGDFSNGQLYAYKQSKDGKSGSWMALPMQMDSLINARTIALQKGATAFVRMEWMTMVNGKLYLSETGYDRIKKDSSVFFNAGLANHIETNCKINDSLYEYPFGAVLEFDPVGNEMKLLVAGGEGIRQKSKHFSNPDAISHTVINGKSFLVINEDIIGLSKGRVSDEAERSKRYINEVWWLELKGNQSYTVDDLQRFLIAPAGAETTGGYFSPDGKTYFLNIQHPSILNPPPFYKSVTIAIDGIDLENVKRGKQ